jgi:hypothetical protein
MKTILLTIALAGLLSGQIIINAVSPAIGAQNLAAGGCFTQAVTVTGVATTGMTVTAAPRTFPGNGVTWGGYVSAANTVTLKVCSIIAAFVGASVYDINVLTGGNAAAPVFASALNTGTADAICALGADTSITGITCQATSATSATPFSSTVTIPAGTLANSVLPFSFSTGIFVSASPPTALVTIKLGSTVILTGLTGNLTVGTYASLVSCQITAPSSASASSPVIASCTNSSGLASPARNFTLTPTAPSVAIATNAAQVLSVSITFSAATAGNAVWLQSLNHL